MRSAVLLFNASGQLLRPFGSASSSSRSRRSLCVEGRTGSSQHPTQQQIVEAAGRTLQQPLTPKDVSQAKAAVQQQLQQLGSQQGPGLSPLAARAVPEAWKGLQVISS